MKLSGLSGGDGKAALFELLAGGVQDLGLVENEDIPNITLSEHPDVLLPSVFNATIDFNLGEIRLKDRDNICIPIKNLDGALVVVKNFSNATCFEVFHPAEPIPLRPQQPQPSVEIQSASNSSKNWTVIYFNVTLIMMNATKSNVTNSSSDLNHTLIGAEYAYAINGATRRNLTLIRGTVTSLTCYRFFEILLWLFSNYDAFNW